MPTTEAGGILASLTGLTSRLHKLEIRPVLRYEIFRVQREPFNIPCYVHRHMAQRPEGNISETRWIYSLMNWGHDPLKNGLPVLHSSPPLICYREFLA